MEMRILSAILFLILAPFVGGLLDGAERKLSARMQGRQGPPLLQPFYDVFKLFVKQTGVVNNVQDLFVAGYLIFMAFTGALFYFGGDIMLDLFALTLAGIFYVMIASCASSPYSTLGAQRELVQMMAYEPMVLMTGIGFYIASGSFSIQQIASSQHSAIFTLPGFFVGFLFIMIIKLRKSPFDFSTSHHAHQEIVKGVTTDLSGRLYAMAEIADWYENVFLLSIVGLFVINRNPLSIPAAVIVALICYFSDTLVDNIFPRVKFDLLLSSAWIVTLAAAGINLLILVSM